MEIFDGICITCSDLAAARRFYEALLQIPGAGDETFVTFPSHPARLSLFNAAGMDEMAPGALEGAGYGGCALEFEVLDADAAHQRLLALNAPIVKPPTTQPWGLRSVWARDPSGNIVNCFARILAADAPRNRSLLARRYFERLLNEKDLSVCEELLAPDYVDHDCPPGTPPGPASIRAFVGDFLAAYPDLRVSIDDLIAEGDTVAARLTWLGHQRESGRRYHRRGIIFLRFNERLQLAERWSAYEILAE